MKTADPFNPRLVFALVAVGLFGFAALMLLLAFGGNMGTQRDGRAHAQSVAATGYKGLVELVAPFRETHLVRDIGETYEHLLIVSIEPQTSAEDVSRLLAHRGSRATLFILPKWMTMPDATRRGWVRSIGPGVPIMSLAALGENVRVGPAAGAPPDTVRGESFLFNLVLPVPAAPQVIRGDDITPLVPLGNGALVARLGGGNHYVVADPDLLNNMGLRNAATARAALALIDELSPAGETAVDFDLTLNGLGDDASANLLRLALEPPFLAMTLALLAAALLAGLHGAFRFGPARPEERAIPLGKAALVENSAGLIRLAGREARLGGVYADVMRQEAARAAGAPAWLQGEELDAYLDRLDKTDGPRFSALAERLVNARDRGSLMAAARDLYRWKKDVIA
jgi:hypothetical protein